MTNGMAGLACRSLLTGLAIGNTLIAIDLSAETPDPTLNLQALALCLLAAWLWQPKEPTP